MKVYLKQIDNFSLAAKAESNHWLSIDERVEDGGNGAVVDVGGGLFSFQKISTAPRLPW